MTTDITELAQSLKAAAEKASSGEWAVQFGDEVYITNDDVGYEQVAIATLDARDADYIALANPANVKQLVEALEKAQTKAIEQGRASCELFDEVTALRQRIAELESRTVKLPHPGFITISGERMAVYMKGEVVAALLAAGIKWEDE